MKLEWDELMENLTEETTLKKRELALGAAVCVLLGMVTGMLIAKMATGWSINLGSGNGCGNQNCANNNGNDDQALVKSHGDGAEVPCKKRRHKAK